jgi:hypothetical protein
LTAVSSALAGAPFSGRFAARSIFFYRKPIEVKTVLQMIQEP